MSCQRNCLFTDELADIFHLDYRRSNCIVKCRTESIKALCGCIPFNIPAAGADSTSHCTLEHIDCLNRYKGKFSHGYIMLIFLGCFVWLLRFIPFQCCCIICLVQLPLLHFCLVERRMSAQMCDGTRCLIWILPLRWIEYSNNSLGALSISFRCRQMVDSGVQPKTDQWSGAWNTGWIILHWVFAMLFGYTIHYFTVQSTANVIDEE